MGMIPAEAVEAAAGDESGVFESVILPLSRPFEIFIDLVTSAAKGVKDD